MSPTGSAETSSSYGVSPAKTPTRSSSKPFPVLLSTLDARPNRGFEVSWALKSADRRAISACMILADRV